MSFLQILKFVECLIEGYLVRANTKGILSEHFMYRNWKSKVAIMQEELEPLPWCDQYGMHIPVARILSTGRRISATRRQRDESGGEIWRWKQVVEIWNSV